MYSLVHHTVSDFSKWKEAYDSMDEARKSNGVISGKVMQSESNPNEVFILLEWSDPAVAKGYFSSPSLKDAMEKGGVQGTPDIWFVNEV